jgi:hypothetical protein
MVNFAGETETFKISKKWLCYSNPYSSFSLSESEASFSKDSFVNSMKSI